MNKVIEFIKHEIVLLGGVAIAAIVAALSTGSTLTVALQAAIPLLIAAIVRQLVTNPTPGGDPMADLTALNAAVVQLQTDANSVATKVSQLKVDATSQTDVDAVTTQVAAVNAQLEQVVNS